jgi:hypothetical protein
MHLHLYFQQYYELGNTPTALLMLVNAREDYSLSLLFTVYSAAGWTPEGFAKCAKNYTLK